MQKHGNVNILCSLSNTTLYVEVTSNLAAKVIQHKEIFSRKNKEILINGMNPHRNDRFERVNFFIKKIPY